MRIRAGESSDATFIVAMAQLASVIEDDPPPAADDPALLLGLPPSPDTAVEALAQGAGDRGLDDLGDQLLPDLVEDGLARSWALGGYWRDVGTVQAYWQAHQEFLEETPPLWLDDPQWPVDTRAGGEAAAWLARGAEVENSVVRRAILGDGVVVGADARVGGSEGEVALVGRAAELSAGSVVPPGGRLPEED